MDAGRGARHVPAAAPPGHAVRDRGAVGDAAASGERPGAADRRALARGGGAGRRGRGGGRGAHRPRHARSATPGRRRSCRPRTGWRRWSTCRSASADTFEALRPAIERLARARPLRRELTPEALEAATTAGDLTIIVAGGELEAAVRRAATSTPTRPTWNASAWNASLPRPRAGWPRPASAWRTRRSCRARRPRWSTAPGPARPSWRTRWLVCETGWSAERAGRGDTRPSSRSARRVRRRPGSSLSTVLTKPRARGNIRLCQVTCQSPAWQGRRSSRLEERPPAHERQPDGAAREGHAPADANVQPAAGPARPSRPQPPVARRSGPTDRPDPNVRERSGRQPHRRRPDRGDRPRPIQRREVTDHAPGRAGRPSPDRTRPRRGTVQRRRRQPEWRHPALDPPSPRWARWRGSSRARLRTRRCPARR